MSRADAIYQVNPSWVIGIEGQLSWIDIRGDFVIDPFFSAAKGATTAATFSARMDWVGTLAGRFGYTWDRWMLYGKGGVAWAHDKYALVGSTGSSFTLNARETRAGWMLGAGVEYAFANNWSAKLEYNYMDFGNERVTLAGLAGSTSATAAVDIDQRMHLVKFGLNYRFGDFGKGPMVARY